MSVVSFKILNDLDLEMASKSIAKYGTQNGPWLSQFDYFYNNRRLHASPVQRMNDLLNIVRYDGWNMNRQGQCASILKDIHTGIITNDRLSNFWDLIDKLPKVSLCELPCADNSIIDLLTNSFAELRKILRSWHSSAGTVCFLTKVVLMFNWGHTPAYDTRIRKILDVDSAISDQELTESLVEIGIWLRYFERRFNIDFEKFSTDVMRKASGLELKSIPSGRGFDMMLFSFES